eukprot:m.10381 g.10381  ORF g.10381 m.10381 type:complete len:1297 (-) comp7374_c0_seq1:1724-5614(-)
MGISDITPPMSIGRRRLKLSRRRKNEQRDSFMEGDSKQNLNVHVQQDCLFDSASVDDQLSIPPFRMGAKTTAEPLTPLTPSSASDLAQKISNCQNKGDNKIAHIGAKWLVEREYGWREYTSDVSMSLETAFQLRRSHVSLKINRQMYRVVFNHQVGGGLHSQINTRTGTKRHVRRNSDLIGANNSQQVHGTTLAVSAQVFEIYDESDKDAIKSPSKSASIHTPNSAKSQFTGKRRISRTRATKSTPPHGGILAAFRRQSTLMSPGEGCVVGADTSACDQDSSHQSLDNTVSTGHANTPDAGASASYTAPSIVSGGTQRRYYRKRPSLKARRTSTGEKKVKRTSKDSETGSAEGVRRTQSMATGCAATPPSEKTAHSSAKVPCPLCGEAIWPAHAYFHIETSCGVGMEQRRQQRIQRREAGREGARGARTDVAETLHPRPRVDWLGAVARPDLSAMEAPLLLPPVDGTVAVPCQSKPLPCPSAPLYVASPDAPYYLRNFITVANSVMGASAHTVALLGDAETAALRRLLARTRVPASDPEATDDATHLGASPPAQMLAVRLLLRRHRWIRLKRVSYAEICPDRDMAGVVRELVRLGLAVSDASLTDATEYLELLDVGELRQLWQTLRLPSPRGSLRRADMLQQLLRHGNAQSVLSPVGVPTPATGARASDKSGCGRTGDVGARLQPLIAAAKRIIGVRAKAKVPPAIVKACDGEVDNDVDDADALCAAVLLEPALVRAFKRLEMLFFMNRTYDEQTLATLTLMDMSKATYPAYTINTSSAPLAAAWPCRCAFWAYESALQLEFAMETATEKNDFDSVLQLYVTGCGSKPEDDAGVETGETTTVDVAGSGACARRRAPDPPPRSPSRAATHAALRAVPVAPADGDVGAGSQGAHGANNGPCGQCGMAVGLSHPSAGGAPQHAHLRQFRAQWVWTRIEFLAVVAYERKKDWAAAVALLRRLLAQEAHAGRRGRWYDHLALHMHVHFSDPAAALEVCIEGINDAHVRTGHRLSLIHRAERICRSAKTTVGLDELARVPEAALHAYPVYVVRGYALPDRGVGYAVTYKDGDVLCGVEELVMRHEQRTGGWRGMHCEGALFGTLYGLLYWDVIFMDGVCDVFVSPQQTAPLDFFSSAFFHRRCIAIKRRSAQLRTATPTALADQVREAWTKHHGVLCAGVAWERFDVDSLCDVASCIGAKVLTAALEVLMSDYGHRKGGLPDLVLWRTAAADGAVVATNDNPSCAQHNTSIGAADGGGEARFVEVKSPNDRLSDKQKIWLHVLHSVGANVAVAKVDHVGGRA